MYAAAKAAGEGFFRSLRIELAGAVEVQVLRPGAVRTEMHRKSGISIPDDVRARFPSAATTAAQIANRIEGPPRWATLGLSNQLLHSIGRNAAGLADRAAARASR